MTKLHRLCALLPLLLSLSACESAYYSVMEEMGVHKRDILIDRVEEAQTAQQQGKQQFQNALEQFREVLSFDGGQLQDAYDRLNSEYEKSEAAAATIRDRIGKVDDVAKALFQEWSSELDLYTNGNLRRDSERQLNETQQRYASLFNAMRNAEATIDPVLDTLRDNTLYLKHNLNARAISSLRGELGTVNDNVSVLISAMENAIAESDLFIARMKQG
ncbi:MAG: DNA repair protein [SAR86 cluster bacterium]|uniref:DNA repair protein n=1 Tax=SAR86 cluster bacterium TaxID=2030880 RepID=A0A2A4MPW5_9GAMM|nr:MAG: DNA repair protein [SAR86 cluster bacterium]